MRLAQVAAQLYTVREHCQTAATLAASLRQIRAIGYQAVQVSGIGPILSTEVARILDSEGLVCAAIHEPGTTLFPQTDAVIERLHTLRCQHVAYPYPRDIDLASPDAVLALCRDLDTAGQRLRAAGARLSYHNHSIEFLPLAGTTVLDFIFKHTDALTLGAELDTYWVQHGGGDVVAWCRRLRGRLPILHLKDYTIRPDKTPIYTEIGRGNLDFPRICAEAEASGCEWFIVEQDTCPGDPFASLKISYDHIAAHLATS